MTIKKYGKCATCQLPTTEIREFHESIDMFQGPTKPGISKQIEDSVRDFRDEAMFCEAHYEEK